MRLSLSVFLALVLCFCSITPILAQDLAPRLDHMSIDRES